MSKVFSPGVSAFLGAVFGAMLFACPSIKDRGGLTQEYLEA